MQNILIADLSVGDTIVVSYADGIHTGGREYVLTHKRPLEDSSGHFPNHWLLRLNGKPTGVAHNGAAMVTIA